MSEKSGQKFDILFFCVQLSIPILYFSLKEMVNMESLQTQPIESPREKLNKNFEKIRGKLKNEPVEYKDSKWEKILIESLDDQIRIFKAQDSNKDILRFPALWNIKSEYALIRNRNWSFSLRTATFTDKGSISFPTSRNKVDNLDYFQLRDSLKKFESRIIEANDVAQNKKNEQYKQMQQYAYNQEVQDKNDADNLINNLDNLDDSQLA